MSAPASDASGAGAVLRLSTDAKRLEELLAPLIRLEMASIGAIETAVGHESHPGYVMLFHEAKTSKQASVEQLSTLLRLAERPRVKSGGMIEPMLRLETLALQKASTNALLGAMRLVESTLVDRYAQAASKLSGLARTAVEGASHRARKRWMILTAHIGQRKDGESSHAQELPQPLSHYFASDEDRVCMRCLLDRPGAAPALEKQDPVTYICAACHAEARAAFPADLQQQMPRWPEQDLHDRVIHKALGRPMKLEAVKEVHALLAGLPSPAKAAATVSRNAKVAASPTRDGQGLGDDVQPASRLTVPDDGISVEESSYTTLLFDYRSVRKSW